MMQKSPAWGTDAIGMSGAAMMWKQIDYSANQSLGILL